MKRLCNMQTGSTYNKVTAESVSCDWLKYTALGGA